MCPPHSLSHTHLVAYLWWVGMKAKVTGTTGGTQSYCSTVGYNIFALIFFWGGGKPVHIILYFSMLQASLNTLELCFACEWPSSVYKALGMMPPDVSIKGDDKPQAITILFYVLWRRTIFLCLFCIYYQFILSGDNIPTQVC